MDKFIENLANLFKVKTLVTLTLTAGMLLLLSGEWQPAQDIIALYSTSYGAVMTYFFTRKDGDSQ